MKSLFKAKITFLFLGVFLLLLTACNKDGGNSQYFTLEPLIVTSTLPTTMVKSRFVNSPKFYAPMLDNQFLTEGECLLANFGIDYDNQSHSDYYTITEMAQSVIVDKTTAFEGDTLGMASSYDTPIIEMGFLSNGTETILIKEDHAGTVAFGIFAQTKDQGSSFAYQMCFDSNTGSAGSTPCLYICAKASGTIEASTEKKEFPYAFDLSAFLEFLKDSSGKTVTIDIKCYTGKDEANKPIYKKLTSIQTKI